MSTVTRLPQTPAVDLIEADAFDALDGLISAGGADTVDLVVADPPYLVGKADRDTPRPLWEAESFHETWLDQCRRLLSPDGSLWVSGTSTSIYLIGRSLQRLGMVIVNSVAWVKPSPPPLIPRTMFKHSHELVIWAKRSTAARPYFNYPLMRRHSGGGAAMGTVWAIAPPRPWEKRHGRHPAQKPEALVERMLLATSPPGGLVLDPFVGSGTTAAVAVRQGRRVIGIDQDADYLAIARRRITDELTPEAPTPTAAAEAA